MPTTKPVPLKSAPGVRRDGTQFDGEEYTAAQWCRFYRGRPKKINGYIAVTSTLPEKVYGMNAYLSDAVNFLALGGASHLEQCQVNLFGNLVAQNDRIPAGFANDPNNMWQFDIFNQGTGTNPQLVAQAAPNLADISSTAERPVYFGPATGTGVLTATAMDSNSGGIVSLYPYLFGYGNSGRVDISKPGDLTVANDSAFVTGQKIVRGLPLRNTSGPGGLLWSIDSVVQAIFNPTITTGAPFNFTTISGKSSILSSQGVIEYDGIYFWMGIDRFLMFNGVVREVPNQYNLNFFFDNINFTWRQKAFVFSVPRWGEIWFCAPIGNVTECNHAVIYNVREGVWYDTPLPNSGRTNGISASGYQRPFMTDLDAIAGSFTLWQHETGLDQINGSNVQPILSSFTTSELDMIDKGTDKGIRVDIVEPDFVQSGNMAVTVVGRSNARASDQESQTVIYPDLSGAPLSANDQVVRFKKGYRLLRFIFQSNAAGGDYYMGKSLAHIEPVEGKITS